MLRFLLSRRACGTPPDGGRDTGVARLGLVLGAAAAVLAGGTAVGVVLGGPSHSRTAVPSGPTPTPTAAPPVPRLALVGQSSTSTDRTTVPWQRPLTLAVTDGTIRSVTARGPRGPVAGTLTPTAWTGPTTLLPSSTYVLHAVLADRNGSTTALDRTLTTSPAATVLHAQLSPTSPDVGVGQPVVLRLDHPVRGPAARTALLGRLHVTTTPAVEGAWHFFNSTEVHYRPRAYWEPGTKVTVVADLSDFQVPGTETWGSDTAHSASFTVGDSLISTVDITAHTMSVRRNGQLLRVLPVSTGRAQYPTKGGVHIILTVEKEHLYNSATVGIPTAGPDGYYEKLPFSMRISNGGAFVHANPATVKFQGRLNVSHGCVNLSLADAQWFYAISHRGDVVNVVHAVVAPVLSDAGMADWNYSWTQWQAGNLG